MLSVIFLGCVAAVVSATTHNVTSSCEALKRMIPSEILLRDDAHYAEVASKNW
jgi:hypothetical protein